MNLFLSLSHDTEKGERTSGQRRTFPMLKAGKRMASFPLSVLPIEQ